MGIIKKAKALRSMVEIGLRLRDARKGKNQSLEVLAGLSGLSRSRVARFEKGTANPRLNEVLQLADAVGLSPVELFEDTTAPKNGLETVQRVLAVLGSTLPENATRVDIEFKIDPETDQIYSDLYITTQQIN